MSQDYIHVTFVKMCVTYCISQSTVYYSQVELFRELQMLSSDYLRQRALYCLQDLVTRYLTEETLQRQTQDDNTAVSAEYTTVAALNTAERSRQIRSLTTICIHVSSVQYTCVSADGFLASFLHVVYIVKSTAFIHN